MHTLVLERLDCCSNSQNQDKNVSVKQPSGAFQTAVAAKACELKTGDRATTADACTKCITTSADACTKCIKQPASLPGTQHISR